MDSDHSKWNDVFSEELSQIKRRRTVGTAIKEDLVGLAFSGGGIRSATFGLGVLEGLKEIGLLKRIDYLSTVSGGGYIGAWLSANCKRAPERKAFAKAALDLATMEVSAIESASAAGKPTAREKEDAAEKAAAARKAYEGERDWLDENADWKLSIAHLRRYSNYLSPRVGFFSADTWSVVAIWIRNTLLVQITVILAIAMALLVPRPLFAGFQHWPEVGNWRWVTVALFILGVAGIAGNLLRQNKVGVVPFLLAKSWATGLIAAALCLGAAVGLSYGFDFQPFTDGPIKWRLAAPIAFLLVLTGFCLLPAAVKMMNLIWRVFWPRDDPPREINYTQGWVQMAVALPMMATGYLVAAVLWGQTTGIYSSGDLADVKTYGGFFTTAWQYWPLPLSVAFASLWLLSICSIRSRTDIKGLLAAFFAPVPAVVVLHALLCAIMLLLHWWGPDHGGLPPDESVQHLYEGRWLAFIWTPAMVLFAFSLSIVMLIGIMGRQSTEGVREWWSRLGAWLIIYGMAWLLVAVAAAYGPLWATFILDSDTWKGASVIGGWLVTTVGGLLAGKSDSTGGGPKRDKSEKTSADKMLNIVAAIAPFVFIAGLLIGISTGLHLIILGISNQDWSYIRDLHWKHWEYLTGSSLIVVSLVMGATFLLLLMMAARVDINEFSLNAFYRSRLSRCYLGATRYLPGQRSPQKFTGFDDKDDLHMAELGSTDREPPPAGPLHIVNCALNLGGSSDLALHTRHSASFTLSPYAAGSNYGSRDQTNTSKPLGYQPICTYGGSDGQPTLGQAISVSGAAASPNMGYHTSPVVAFLLTVFNVRLGWWFPNPRISGIKSPSPSFSLRYLVKELFGGADDKSNFLMISDGGHFENLAAYELIRRECRVIVISDAECDPNLQFEGLGTLIRMCEVDFGARITIDVNAIRPHSGSNWSGGRCAVGKIEYRRGKPDGVLIYLKASMTGHEDSAILQYKASHPAFPHEPTTDQFYGEDQFESYRRLGKEVATRTFAPVSKDGEAPDFVILAGMLQAIWSPAPAHLGRFTQHGNRLMDLWTQLGSNQKVQVLAEKDEKLLDAHWPDDNSPESFRPVFYVCSQMIQLMENVYLDLGLEDTWENPDNEGWRNLFRSWSESAAIRKTWEMSARNFGRRFQYFCDRNFNFPIPDPGQGE